MVARRHRPKMNVEKMRTQNRHSPSMGIMALLFVAWFAPVTAQSNRPQSKILLSEHPNQQLDSASRVRMQSMALVFITEELNMDEKEAERFRITFNEIAPMEVEREMKQRRLRMELKDASFETRAEFNVALEALLAVELEQTSQRATLLRVLADEFDPDFAMRCLEARMKFKRVMRERMEARTSKKRRYPMGEIGEGSRSN